VARVWQWVHRSIATRAPNGLCRRNHEIVIRPITRDDFASGPVNTVAAYFRNAQKKKHSHPAKPCKKFSLYTHHLIYTCSPRQQSDYVNMPSLCSNLCWRFTIGRCSRRIFKQRALECHYWCSMQRMDRPSPRATRQARPHNVLAYMCVRIIYVRGCLSAFYFNPHICFFMC
jgi:hypothetical protein